MDIMDFLGIETVKHKTGNHKYDRFCLCDKCHAIAEIKENTEQLHLLSQEKLDSISNIIYNGV